MIPREDQRLLDVQKEIAELISDSDIALQTPQLTSAFENIVEMQKADVGHFEVIMFSAMNDLPIDSLAEMLGGCPKELTTAVNELSSSLNAQFTTDKGLKVTLNLCSNTVHLNDKLGAIPPSLTFVLLQETDERDTAITELIRSRAYDAPGIILVSLGKEQFGVDFLRVIEEEAILFSYAHFDGTEKWQISPGPLNDVVLQQHCRKYAVVKALEDVLSVYALAMQNEERNLKAKRIILQQQAFKLQSQTEQKSTEALNTLKSLVNNRISELERGVTDRMENSLKASTGSLIPMITQITDTLTELDESKQSGKLYYTISPDAEDSFYSGIRKLYNGLCNQTLVAISDEIRILKHDLIKLCNSHQIPEPQLNLVLLTDHDLNEILGNTIRIDRPYQGLGVVKGIYDYFMAMRKYQMIAFMLMSTLGLSLLGSIRLYMIPASVMLLGLGGISVYRRVEKERDEAEQRELAKAKESLTLEGKRIGAEIVRQWSKVTTDFLRQTSNHLTNQLEDHIKKHVKTCKEKVEIEKNILQRKTHAIDNSERKLSQLHRSHETAYRNLLRVKSDYRHAILKYKPSLSG